MSDWTEAIDLLIEHLRYLRENDIHFAPLAAATLTELRRDVAVASSPTATRAQSAATAPATPANREAALASLSAQMLTCQNCALAAGRKGRIVAGQGKIEAPDIMFIGDAPTLEEEQRGEPFLGTTGELLTKMIAAMGYERSDVFLTNICKCAKPGNAKPSKQEMQTCLPFLAQQIEIIQPKTIVVLGATAATGIFNTQTGIPKLRGQWTLFNNIPLMPTFHPEYLLRFAAAKRRAWDDLKGVLAKLGKSAPKKN